MSSNAAPISFVFQATGAEKVKSQFASVGSSAKTMGTQTERAAVQADKAHKSFSGAALGMASAASGAASLAFSFTDLRDRQLAIAETESQLISSKASLNDAQTQLNELTASGVTSGAEYEKALLQVSLAQQDVANTSEDLSIKNAELQQSYTQIGLQTIPTVLGSVTALQGGFGGLGKAGTKAAGGIRTMGRAVRGAMTAMGPIGLALTGVSIVMGLFATNAFGIRDAVNAAGKAIGDAIPILRPLLEMLGNLANSIFPDATAAAEDNTDALGENTGATEDNTQAIVENMDATTAGTKADKEYLESVGFLTAGMELSTEQMRLATDVLKGQAAETYRARLADLELVSTQVDLEDALFFTDEQLKNMADSMRAYKDSTLEAKDAVDSLTESESRRNRLSSGEEIQDRARRAGLIGEGATMTGHRGSITSFIEHHARGGVVNEPTLMLGMNSGRLGIMGEAGPEAIVPMGGGGSRTIIKHVIHTHVNLNGREIADAVDEETMLRLGEIT